MSKPRGPYREVVNDSTHHGGPWFHVECAGELVAETGTRDMAKRIVCALNLLEPSRKL